MMTASDQNSQAKPAVSPPGQETRDGRSENLLPGGSGDQDGRFDVAEEVNLDQQSDTARHIGQASPTDPRDDIERAAPRVPGTT
jgi:hypothetical protein